MYPICGDSNQMLCAYVKTQNYKSRRVNSIVCELKKNGSHCDIRMSKFI